jgi:chemotaxis protein methyltransferase CheR
MEASAQENETNEEIELQLLLEAIYMKYGYDFRNYSKAHLKRRIAGRLSRSGCSSISEMQHEVLYNVNFFHKLIRDLSINVTAMFRDPAFFRAIRTEIVPLLKTYPFIKIWHAGCSTGEEVYSMAILLKEEGLLERTIIYATDFNQIALQQASEAIYPVDKIKEYSDNYFKAEGKASFSEYFTVKYNSALIDKNLKKNIVFSDHNLVTDGIFAEMNLIFCRNVLIYFNRELQNKVFNLFYESLIQGGILCLGSKETLYYSDHKKDYKQLHDLNIYKKLYTPD